MKSIFKNLKLFFARQILYLKNVWLVLFLLMLAISSSGVSCSALSIGKYTKNNIPQSLCNVVQKADMSKTGGIIYYHDLLKTDGIHFSTSENTKQMRSIYADDVFIDFYPANWMNEYSPGSVAIGSSETQVTLLLWPKPNYVGTTFTYQMPLLFGSIEHYSSPNDVFIPKAFADYIINIEPTLNNYSDIINSKYVFSMKYNHRNRGGESINYCVKGIIDDGSEEYKYYYNIFGFFFLVPEYFTMPIPSMTYFKLRENSYKNKPLFTNLLKIYEYKSEKNYVNGIYTYKLQARMTFAENISDIKDIDTNQKTKFTEKTDLIFDSFIIGNQINNFVFPILLNVLFVVLFIFSLVFIHSIHGKYQLNNNGLILSELFLCLSFYPIGLLFALIINAASKVPYLAFINTIGIFIGLLEIFISLIIYWLVVIFMKYIKQKRCNN